MNQPEIAGQSAFAQIDTAHAYPVQPFTASAPPYPPPVTIQPGIQAQPLQRDGTTPPPDSIQQLQGLPNCPPGLEYLTQIDQLLVHQKVELLEAITGFETANKYTIKNTLGQKVYWATENTDCLTRNCCGPARSFEMSILDCYKHEVLHLSRPLRCPIFCCKGCMQTLEVSAPPGNVIGTIEQERSFWTPKFSIKDQTGSTVLRVVGPCRMFRVVEFPILTTDGIEVGKLTKQWSGFIQEAFTDADNFEINFPMDLDVRMKATLLGCLFLIDYMFFEKFGQTPIIA